MCGPNGCDSAAQVLRFVDAERLSPLGAVRIPGHAGTVAWTPRGRVLVASRRCCPDELRLVVVDAARKRVVARTKFAGEAVGIARSRDGLVVLLGPPKGFARTRLLVVDGLGRIRSVGLDVVGGTTWPRSEPYLARQRVPGLTVDRDGGRAYVVAPDGRVAAIELGSLAVSYHRPTERVSLLARLRNWLEPAAHAKASDGPVRVARWLGGGLLAVAGTDARAVARNGRIVRQTLDAIPVTIVDTRNWTLRRLDGRAIGVIAAGDFLLATGGELGLAAYDPDGRRRWQRYEGEGVWVQQVAAGRVYVAQSTRGRVDIVDLGTGAMLGHAPWQPFVRVLDATWSGWDAAS